jgi:hypothetical protein
MTEDDLNAITAILQSAIFPVLGFVAGFLATWILQSRKSRDELLKELAPRRADSLQALWKLTTPFARDPDDHMASERRSAADGAFRKWYFEEAGALFLSWRATKHYLKAIDCLRDPKSSSQALKGAFSLLRTELKRDCGIYTWWHGFRRLPSPRHPLASANQPAARDAAPLAVLNEHEETHLGPRP